MPDHLTGVLGVGHRFDFGLDIEAEYLYNGAGDSHDWFAALQRVADGRAYHMGEHLFGLASDGTDWALVLVDQYIQGLGTKLRLVGMRVTPDGSIIDAVLDRAGGQITRAASLLGISRFALSRRLAKRKE